MAEGGPAFSGPIKLGGWFPLTGGWASSGIPQEVGAPVYWQKFNDDGGVDGTQVEFLTEDNAVDPQQTIGIEAPPIPIAAGVAARTVDDCVVPRRVAPVVGEGRQAAVDILAGATWVVTA